MAQLSHSLHLPLHMPDLPSPTPPLLPLSLITSAWYVSNVLPFHLLHRERFLVAQLEYLF